MPDLKDVVADIEGISLEPIPHKENRPYMLLDGLLPTAHNVLLNIAIGQAAHEVHDLNVGYLCFRPHAEHYSTKLFEQAGIPAFDIAERSSNQHVLSKSLIRLSSYWRALRSRSDLLQMEIDGIRVGDLIYDSILRNNSEICTLTNARYSDLRGPIENALRRFYAVQAIYESEPIAAQVLSHKVYARYGIPARLATAHGIGVISKSRAHLNRVSSVDDHYENDYVLTTGGMDKVVEAIGQSRLNQYVEERFEGEVGGADATFAFENKVGYSPSDLKVNMNLDDRPVALIAPHAFSDAPHCDREMIYRDYYQWFVRTLELTVDTPHVQWVVKPHPSSSLYDEEGIVEELVAQYDHVQLVPSDVKTDSVLRIADVVLTVRGTIGMEALLFDCAVILGGNAIYDDIASVTVCLDECDFAEALSSIGKEQDIPDRSKIRAMAALYYRNKSYRYVSPLFGPERPPGISQKEAREHDHENIKATGEFLENHVYADDKYYRQLCSFFDNQDERLSIIDLTD